MLHTTVINMIGLMALASTLVGFYSLIKEGN